MVVGDELAELGGVTSTTAHAPLKARGGLSRSSSSRAAARGGGWGPLVPLGIPIMQCWVFVICLQTVCKQLFVCVCLLFVCEKVGWWWCLQTPLRCFLFANTFESRFCKLRRATARKGGVKKHRREMGRTRRKRWAARAQMSAALMRRWNLPAGESAIGSRLVPRSMTGEGVGGE